MICLGNAILNEDYIVAIRPVDGDGFVVPEANSVQLAVGLASGAEVIVHAKMEEARKTLEHVGVLEPAAAQRLRPGEMFSLAELSELHQCFLDGFLFAAKDEDGCAFVYSEKPRKGKKSWLNDDDVSKVRRLLGPFDVLSFKDEQPLDISGVLPGKEEGD